MSLAHASLLPPGDEFVGRGPELDALASAFDAGARLVTMIGTGGIGKTRLAIQYVTGLPRRRTGQEVALVDLGQARSLEAFLGAVAQALEISLRDDAASVERVGNALAGRATVLVVLDNVEQIVDAVALAIGAWRGLAPEARFLVTSRMPLGLAGERRVQVPPLPLDDARALFEARARAVDHDFRVRPGDRDALAQLLARLEGLPLAIELAAARVTTLTLPSLCTLLGDSLGALRSTRRDASPRHSSLAATIAWSWELLGAREQSALAQCSVFRGGFTLEAATAVLRLDSSEPHAVLDTLQALGEQSLLRCERDPERAETRFRLCEPIRELAAAELAAAGGTAGACDRHADHCLAIAEPATALGALYATPGTAALRPLSAELDNLFAAMQRSAERKPAVAARLGLALANLLHFSGPRGRCVQVLEEALGAADRAADLELRCRLLVTRVATKRQWGWAGDTAEDPREALALARRLDHPQLEGLALYNLGMVFLERRELAAARRELDQALALQTGLGDDLGRGLTLEGLAVWHIWTGDYPAALALHEQAILASGRAGNLRWQSISLRNSGVVHQQLGDPRRALRESERALAIHLELRDFQAQVTLTNMAEYATQLRDLDAAHRHVAGALERVRHGEATPRLGDPFTVRAWIHVAEDELLQAEEVLDEGLAWHDRFGASAARTNALIVRGAVRALRGRLAEAREDLGEAAALCAGAHAEEVTDAPVAAALRAAVELLDGDRDAATRWFAHAQGEAARWKNQRFDRTVAALAPCFGAADRAGAADRECEAARTSESAPAPFLEELVTRALAARILDGGVLVRVLAVGPHLAWVQPPDGARVDLRRKPVLQRLIGALVAARRERAQRSLPSQELVAQVWPGDRSEKAALENRLWVAVSALRKLGLGEILQKDGDGYQLDPQLELELDAAEARAAAPPGKSVRPRR